MDKFIVSARKYRPATFSTLIGQDSIATTLKNSIKRNQLAHAYLFCGPRGVGKTTTARIFAKIINCMNPGSDMEPCGECESCKSFDEGRSYCIHELDAASNNSVDDIRSLTEKVMIPPQVGKYGVYIIDEVHMLSTSAFNAFLKTLEEPPAHAIFILATTEKQKIIPTILSRCQVYDFNRISIPDIVRNLRTIAEKEGVTIDDESLHVIAQKADGAMRDALTLFDQVVAYCSDKVDYDSVIKNLNVLDYEYYFRLTDYALEGRFADSLVLFDEVLNKGFNALYFVGGLGNHLRNLLICKETASAKLLEVSPALEEKYRAQAERCKLMFLFKALSVTEKCEADYARSNNQRLLVEFMLVRMSQINEAPATRPEPAQQPTAQPVAAAPAADAVKQTPQQPATEPSPQPATPQSATETVQQEPQKPSAQPTVAEAVQQPAAQQPQPDDGLSIGSLLNQVQQEEKPAATSEDAQPLAFMGPSMSKSVTIEAVKAAWKKLAEDFAARYPKLVRFSATINQTVPVLEEDNLTIDFIVGNTAQKEWIEKNTGSQMGAFLRKELQNEKVKLAVKIKSREEVATKLYMPSEKEKYLEQKNPEFSQLKKDMGLELT